MNFKAKYKGAIWYAVIAVVVLFLDQLTKTLVANSSGVAGLGEPPTHLFWIIPSFIEITYCENKNGAMGIFRNLPNKDLVFTILTAVILVCIFVYLFLSKKKKSVWLKITLALIISGAIGNFIDRLTTVYVRDFIHVILPFGKDKDFFPYIFNVADMALVVGAIMLIVHLLFLDKDALFASKKKREAAENAENAERGQGGEDEGIISGGEEVGETLDDDAPKPKNLRINKDE